MYGKVRRGRRAGKLLTAKDEDHCRITDRHVESICFCFEKIVFGLSVRFDGGEFASGLSC